MSFFSRTNLIMFVCAVDELYSVLCILSDSNIVSTRFSGDTLLRHNDLDPLLNSCFKIKFQMYCQKKKLHINILQLKFQYSVTHVLIFI